MKPYAWLLLSLFLLFRVDSETIAISIQSSDYEINQYSTYTFNLQRYLDPLTPAFIDPVDPVPVNSIIKLVFPSDYITISNETNPSCFNGNSGGTLSCTVYEENNTVIVDNYYADTSTAEDNEVKVTINNIKNPTKATETANFEYYIIDAGSVVDEGPAPNNPSYSSSLTFTSGTFTSCSISANNNSVLSRSKYSFTLTPKNSIPSEGKLIIDFPLTWTNDRNGEQTIVSTTTCEAVSNVASSVTCFYTIFSSPINIARITVSSLTTATLSGTFQLDISPILVPPTENSIQTVEMRSEWSDGIDIDTCTSTITQIKAESLDTMSFTSLDETVVQSTFNGRLEVTIEKLFYYQDQIVLTLPSNFITNNQIQLTSSNFQSFITTVNGNDVTMSNFPSSPENIAANNIITIFMVDVVNYQSVEPQDITISFYRSGNIYQQGTTSYSATQGNLTSFTISSDSTIVNVVGVSQLQMQTALFIPSNSYIELTYSSTINANDLSQTSVASASLGGFKITGVKYSIADNLVTITELYSTQFDSGTMIVSLGQFTNPPTVQSTVYFLSIYSSTNYLILSSQYAYTAQRQTLLSNAVSSNSLLVMDSTVTYTISFQSSYGYKAVSVIVPDDVSVGQNYETTCLPNLCSLSGNNLTFTSTKTSGGNYTLSWGDNTNPNSLKPTSSFKIYTYSSGFGVQQYSGQLTLTMNTEALLLSSLITPSSLKNNEQISVTFDYILPANTPSGTVSIQFPSVLDISSASCSSSCTIIPPHINQDYTNTNTSQSQSITLVVNAVVNAPSFSPVPSFAFKVESSAGYQSISQDVSAWTNTLSSSFTTEVQSNDAYKGEQALFRFSLSELSGKQVYVHIKINPLFSQLTTAPTDATLINGYQVQYNISGEGSVELSFLLTTPVYGGNYTFSLQTYTEDGYTIGKSTTNIWQHNCFGTQCRSCENSGACIDCYDETIPGTKNIFNTLDSTCVSACNDGYYLTGIQCSLCDSNCLQCESDSTNCTKCNNGSYLNTIYDTCLTDCGDTFYANDLNNLCTSCTSPCLKCSSDILCLSCVEGFYLLNEECKSSCPADLMVKNDVTRTCDFCDDNCLTCETFDYQCTSCNNSLGLYLDVAECVSQCSTNRFIKNNVCSDCESPCKQCYNSTTTCSTCWRNQTLSLWFNYGCISEAQCNNGYYPHTTNGSCDSCLSQCSECIALNNCTSCNEGYYLFSFGCLPSCPNITFSNDATRTCDDCSGCVTCSEETVCTSCEIDQFLYSGQCYTTCPSATYSQGYNNTFGQCLNCPSDCPTCLNQSYCLSCVNGQFLYKGVCYISCPTQTFSSGTNCEDCYQTCLTCTSLDNCLTCQPDYSLENGVSCVLNCQVGISFEQICYPCGLNCALCENATCQRCETTYLLYNNVCLDSCTDNTLTMDGLTCVHCSNKFINCTTCNQSQCFSCSDGELVNGTCSPCAPGYYSRNSQCALCPSSCTVCESTTFCSECADDHYIEADYCVDTCPDNKIPNGTVCDICVVDCAICDIETSLCSVCSAGIYLYQGECLKSCPSPLVVNLNGTKCLTREQYYEEYSNEAKIIWFPFTISFVIVIIIGVILKCYMNVMHLATFLVSCLSWFQLGSWVLFGIIQYLVYVNGHDDGLKGIICALVGIGLLILTNIVFVIFYNKYFTPDSDFKKWERDHCCINMLFVIFGTIFSFKAHRLIYCKLLDREEFSMVLSSVKKLIPISVLTIISLFVSSIPFITGSSLALYFSIATDQEFFAALDTLIVSGTMVLLMLLDLRHSHNYFIDQLETQNIKNKIYDEDDEKIQIDGQSIDSHPQKDNGNISRQNLLQAAEDMDYVQTKKNFHRPSNSQGANRNKILKAKQSQKQDEKGEEKQESNLQGYEKESQEELVQNFMKWVPKQFDHHGYMVKYDENNNPTKYDENGYRVEIDEEGVHHKYDENGNEVIIDENGKHVKYNDEGFIVGENGQLYDKRGYRIVKTDEGLKYYDKNGYEVIGEGEDQYKIDQNGYIVKVDGNNQHRKYTKEGYEVKKGQNGEEIFFNEDGKAVRKNKYGKWESYDPEDGFILIKNGQTGQYEKFDELGFKIEKDQYGNVYRYDDEGYRVIVSDGKVTKYDEEGFQIRKDSDGNIHKYDKDGYEMILNEEGEPVYYDSNGYRVERDFYGNPTFYDTDGNQVIIDEKTGKHRKFNSEGLQIVTDENGEKYLKDKRGRKVVELEDGFYEKFDENENKLWLDEDGYEVEHDEDGNVLKYDKAGDLVQDSFEDDDKFEGMAIVDGKEQKKEKKGKFKTKRQFDFEEEYNKMLEEEKPKIIFDESDSGSDDLKEFHDYEPPNEKNLEKDYRDMYDNERDQEKNRKESNSIQLQDLEDIEQTPYKNLQQKKIENNGEEEDEKDENKVTLNQESEEKKHQIKSVVDVSIDKRSFQNEGIQPISRKDSKNDELESIGQIDPVLIQKRKRKNRRSQMSFDQSGEAIQTKSENNFMKGEKQVKVNIQNKKENKIYDSEEEVQSLGEEDWEDNATPYLFYKNKEFSNANTNANEKMENQEDQEDILSDFIPQQAIRNEKSSEENLLTNRYMQSIEEVEDELFDKLKSEDNKVKRTEFRLSGTPNPLLEYAKSIQAKKSLKEKMFFEGLKKK